MRTRKFPNPPPEPKRPGIKGQCVARRAFEIALAGHHSIGLIGPRGSGRHYLADAFPAAKARVFDTCPCGNRLSLSFVCSCTPDACSVHYAVHAPELLELDILVEVVQPPLRDMDGPGMSVQDWEHLEARVADTRARAVHVSTLNIEDDAAQRTREMIVRRLGLTCQQYVALMQVSRTIATLDHSTNIKAKHLAEAAQYLTPALPHFWNMA